MRRVADGLAVWILVGVIGWAGIIAIGWTLWQSSPPRAGFDLALLLEAARRVTAGQSPYDPAMLAGTAPDATSLFYSYPPPVAQTMTLLAWLPDGVVLVLWGLGATLGLGLVAWRIGLAAGRTAASRDALKTMAVSSLILPFAVAVLFGNLDAWYGLAFGVVVLAIALPNPTPGRSIMGGVALGVVSVAKLHPASLLVWLLVRALIDPRGPARRMLAAAIVTGIVLVLGSLVAGGIGLWQDYLAVLRAGSGAAVVDPRNVGPVSLLGQIVPLDATSIRLAQVVVALAAVAITALVAARVRDPLASMAAAIALSLVVLPVTWYHYPVSLIPVGIALVAIRPASRVRVAVAAILADLAVGFVPLLWVGVAALLFAAGAVPARPQLHAAVVQNA
ncbi:MAG: glycosyltransferase family 87 protein [Candidatus Limnocylindrales bacterium]